MSAGCGDAQLGDTRTDVDNHGQQPLHDETGAIANG
jgi:hypothetical protein